ncbi:MAG: MotA/TolQ/ExbB proton channel family protein [Planctomycetaceae bacterium]|nr:MotA/TolQ/ExbB proton channel family protein [Planctomycetaceae bacterium]
MVRCSMIDNRSKRLWRGWTLVVMLVAAFVCSDPVLSYQDQEGQGEGATAEESVAGPSSELQENDLLAEDVTEETGPSTASDAVPGINIFSLLLEGSWFMIPIVLMSLLTVTFAVERFLGLRRTRVIPSELVAELGKMGADGKSFDPRQAYRICQRFPSAAANVIRVMLLKVGRPHSEVEHAVAEASEREAERLYGNVRWLNLAAAVAPLMGLLGTVWGMIRAFHDTTQLQAGQNKADYLAGGIYAALVTTLGGLMVAIPAAICAHYFETRVQKSFHEIDELLFNLTPQVERFEGRVRFSRQGAEGTGQPTPVSPVAETPGEAPAEATE